MYDSSHGKKLQHAAARDPEESQKQRRLYQEQMRQLDPTAFVLVDATGETL
jgi:hypothetical protein